MSYRADKKAAEPVEKVKFVCGVCGRGNGVATGGRCALCDKRFCLACGVYSRVRHTAVLENDFEMVCKNCGKGSQPLPI